MTDPIVDKLQRALNEGAPDKAKEIYKEQRSRLEGNPIAQFEFARQAAVLGLREAVHFVVKCYQDGNGTEPDHVKAFEWIRKAATRDNDPQFAFELACCYRDGDGTARDIKGFWEWMTKAADGGETEAMFQLATAYQEPKLGPPSPERVAEWTVRMAELRQPSAMIQLARKFDEGPAAERDPKKFLERAIEAVDAARDQWEKRSDRKDWAYEDLPEALALWADALARNGRRKESGEANREAACEAWNAYQVAVEMGADVGHLLPEIMLRLLPELRGSRGELLTRHRTLYFEWLGKVRSAVDRIYLSSGAKEIPSDLVVERQDLLAR